MIRNSEMVMTICSRTKGYCFQEQYAIVLPIVFLLFYNLKIPKQGIKMQIFFLNGLWRSLKNGHLPVKLHSSASPPRESVTKGDPWIQRNPAFKRESKAVSYTMTPFPS